MTHHAHTPETGTSERTAEPLRKSSLNDGDVVGIEREGDHLRSKTRKQMLDDVQAAYCAAIKVPFSVDEFLIERAAEAAREI